MPRKTRSLLTAPLLVLGALALATGNASAQLPQAAALQEATVPAGDEAGSYAFVRTVEGEALWWSETATVDGGDAVAAEPVEVSQPLLAGDRLRLERDTRLEVMLPDGTLLRLEGPGELELLAVAGPLPGDAEEASTGYGEPEEISGAAAAAAHHLVLVGGDVQVVLAEDPVPGEEPRIDVVDPRPTAAGERAAGAIVWLHAAGRYRIAGEPPRVTVRHGMAELETAAGSVPVRAGEHAILAAGERVEVDAAGPVEGVERWGRLLESEARLATTSGMAGAAMAELPPRVRYAAAPLARHGAWIHLDGGTVWRPRVAAGWHPYFHGRWTWTPAGLYWISHEPWGYVPHHYGSWHYERLHGWVWIPGPAFAPAWVTWYWGPTHVAWRPLGHHLGFGPHHRHRRWGYSFAPLHDPRFWVLCPADRFGRRGSRHFFRPGHRFAEERHGRGTGRFALPRGLVSPDTAALPRDRWRDREEVVRTLDERRRRRTRSAFADGGVGPGAGAGERTAVGRRIGGGPDGASPRETPRRGPGTVPERGAPRTGADTGTRPAVPRRIAPRRVPERTGPEQVRPEAPRRPRIGSPERARPADPRARGADPGADRPRRRGEARRPPATDEGHRIGSAGREDGRGSTARRAPRSRPTLGSRTSRGVERDPGHLRRPNSRRPVSGRTVDRSSPDRRRSTARSGSDRRRPTARSGSRHRRPTARSGSRSGADRRSTARSGNDRGSRHGARSSRTGSRSRAGDARSSGPGSSRAHRGGVRRRPPGS